MTIYESGETAVHFVGGARDRALVDIIFIHGLGGHAKRTWMRDEAIDDTFWPQWLVHDFPEACVWSAEYPAASGSWLNVEAKSIPLQTVVFPLLDRFEQKGFGSRPIVLVAHSLGGLVAKQLVRAAAEITATEPWRKIGLAIKAVMFIATPHTGSSLADLVMRASKVVPGWLFKATDSIKGLQTSSINLDQLSDWYRQVAHERSIATRCYREDIPTNGLWVVPLDRANPALLGVTAIPLPFDHKTICKALSRDSQIYEGTVSFIRTVMEKETPTHPLRVSIAAPRDGRCTLLKARDRAADVNGLMEQIMSAAGLPSREWVGAASRMKGTDTETFASAVVEWHRTSGMTLLSRHRDQTRLVRSVEIELDVTNVGEQPAKNVSLEMSIDSKHKVGTTDPRGGSAFSSAPLRDAIPVPPDTVDFDQSRLDQEKVKQLEFRKWYPHLPGTSNDTRRWSDAVFLMAPNGTDRDGPWKFESSFFDLRQGKSVPIRSLFVCFDYDPAHDIAISYSISAENILGLASGTVVVRVEDELNVSP